MLSLFQQAFKNEYDFDCPAAFDWDTLRECVSELKQMKSVEVPVYSFVEHQRTKETQYLYGASVIIIEGLFILSDPELRKLLDMKVFGVWTAFLARNTSSLTILLYTFSAMRLRSDAC